MMNEDGHHTFGTMPWQVGPRSTADELEGGGDEVVDEDEQVRKAGLQGLAHEDFGALHADSQDASIGVEDEEAGQEHTEGGAQHAVDVADQDVSTALLGQGVNVTVQSVHVQLAQWHPAGQQSSSPNQTCRGKPRPDQHPSHRRHVDERVVLQRTADGHISVIGHDRQQNEPRGPDEVDEEGLRDAHGGGDGGLCDRQHVHEELGQDGGAAHHGVEQQGSDENEHGLVVEAALGGDQIQHHQVAQHDEDVRKQEHEEIHILILPHSLETLQSYKCHVGSVSHQLGHIEGH